MQQTLSRRPRRTGIGGTARELAVLAFAAFEAFEALAERRYAAPWAAPVRRTGHER